MHFPFMKKRQKATDVVLGELLCKIGFCTAERLADALDKAAGSERLGDCLVRLGHVSRDRIDQALDLQDKLKCGHPSGLTELLQYQMNANAVLRRRQTETMDQMPAVALPAPKR
jgi:hypothetical protein